MANVNRQLCQERVLEHQKKAKALWKQNAEWLACQPKHKPTPGPGSYLPTENKYYNSFMGEGAQSSFGRAPRLPTHANANERNTAWHKLQMKRASMKLNDRSLHIPVLKGRKSSRAQESSTAMLPGPTFQGDARETDITMWDFKGVKQWPKCNFTPNTATRPLNDH